MRDTIRFDTPITQRQLDALSFISEFIDQRGYAPSIREITNYFGYRSTRSAADLVLALDGKGYISVARGISRGIRLTPKHAQKAA